MPVLHSDQGWFMVFADHDAAVGVAETLRRCAPQVVTHPSGRPWLAGRWAADQLVLAQAGPVNVAVIGCCPVTATALSAAARRVRTAADVDRLAAGLSGSFHLVAAIGGQVRVQGSVSGLRRVFYIRAKGVTVAADRADVLARLAGAGVDEQHLAVWLLSPRVPHPLADACGWQGLRAVPGGCYLLLDRDGPDRVVAWWRPPEPVVPLAEAAPAVREALASAVEARTRKGGTISADLSGGLDSTSLCFLAAGGPSSVVAVTLGGLDPGNDDLRWAEQAAGTLGVEHVVLDAAQLPSRYADIRTAGDGQDGPLTRARNATRDTHLTRLLIRRGCRLHLTGYGGDEVLQAPSAYLHTTFWTHPRTAASHLRGYRGRGHWPRTATLRALTDRLTYPAWLAANADQLTDPPPPRRTPRLGWGPPLRVAPWATPHAAEAATTLLRQAATSAEPLAPTRGQHAALQAVRTAAHLTRHLAQVIAAAGLPLEAPYLDDRVVEVCLSVRLHERATPWQYKPLLVNAMQGVVPAEALARRTKASFDVDVHAGLRRHRADLAALCEDLVLARLGLVDADALRAVCLGLHPPTLPLPALETTLGCEVWLRTHTATAPPLVTRESR